MYQVNDKVVLMETGETGMVKQVVFYTGIKDKNHVITKVINERVNEIDNKDNDSFFYGVEINGAVFPIEEDEISK
jgi:hypothetical protein